MKLELKRRYFADTYTIGALSINGQKFCDTLEDKNRDLNHDGDLTDPGEEKIYSKTAIPFGKYKVEIIHSPHFKRELPWLRGVPHFEGILIHRGNTENDSSGCILVGENKVKGKVINSAKYELELVKLIKKAIVKGETIEIEII